MTAATCPLFATIISRTDSRSLYGATSVPAAAPSLTPGLSGKPSVATPDPACNGKEGDEWNPPTGIAAALNTVERLLAGLTAQNHTLAVQIAAIPDEIRGFGYIKARNLAPARKKRDELLARFEAGPAAERAAA